MEEINDKNIPQSESLVQKNDSSPPNITESKNKMNFPNKKDLSNEVLYFSINQDSK